MIAYHDREWGMPLHDDKKLFEFLCLEGAQAGLSWSTVLNKRVAYGLAFDGFDPNRVACYDESKMQAIGMVNDHIVDCFRYHELK